MDYFRIIGVVALLFLGLFLLAMSSLQEDKPVQDVSVLVVNPEKNAFLKAYSQHFNRERKRLGMPGAALAIVMDSTVFFAEGYGEKIAGSRDFVDKNTVFRIGSLSKGFASVLAGVLQDEEKLHFNDCVIEHLPDFALKTKEQTDELSLEHVLSHTSGLQYHAYTDLIERSWSLENIYKKFETLKLLGEPGEVYAYQNAAYCLAETAMEKRCNKTYEELIQEKIFRPLEMNNASVSKAAMLRNDNVALPHVRGKKGWYKRKISNKYYNAIAAGGVNASILDMAKWLELLLGNRDDVIAEETLQEVFTPRVNIKNRKNYYQRWPGVKDSFYAMGWRILKTADTDLVYHGGQVNNYRSEIAVNPKEKIAICVLSNAKGSFTSRAVPSFMTMYEKYKSEIKNWDKNFKENVMP